jgi:hypothetical protein
LELTTLHGTLSYYSFNNAAVNTFDKKHAESWEKVDGFILKDVLKVKTFELKEVLNHYLPKGQSIDFMTIDVEGLDYNVLISNDWEKYRPQLLLVENNYWDNLNLLENKIIGFLSSVDYKLYDIRGVSLFFLDIHNRIR